jgi:hypothetical protein
MFSIYIIQVYRREKRRHEKVLQLSLPCSVFVSADESWKAWVFCYKFLVLITAAASFAELQQRSLELPQSRWAKRYFALAPPIFAELQRSHRITATLHWAYRSLLSYSGLHLRPTKRNNALPPLSSHTNKWFKKNSKAKDLSSINAWWLMEKGWNLWWLVTLSHL